jgi:hypothetical protein
MFRGLAQLFDDMAIKTMLRGLSKDVAIEYEKSGYASKVADKLARQEVSSSIRTSKPDVDCYHDVRVWKMSYMTGRARVERPRFFARSKAAGSPQIRH